MNEVLVYRFPRVLVLKCRPANVADSKKLRNSELSKSILEKSSRKSIIFSFIYISIITLEYNIIIHNQIDNNLSSCVIVKFEFT